MQMDSSLPYICFRVLINRDSLQKGSSFSHSDVMRDSLDDWYPLRVSQWCLLMDSSFAL